MFSSTSWLGAVGAIVVGITVVVVFTVVASVGLSVTFSDFVVTSWPSGENVYFNDVATDTLLPFTAATEIVYSPEPFSNTLLSKLTELTSTFVTYLLST